MDGRNSVGRDLVNDVPCKAVKRCQSPPTPRDPHPDNSRHQIIRNLVQQSLVTVAAGADGIS